MPNSISQALRKARPTTFSIDFVVRRSRFLIPSSARAAASSSGSRLSSAGRPSGLGEALYRDHRSVHDVTAFVETHGGEDQCRLRTTCAAPTCLGRLPAPGVSRRACSRPAGTSSMTSTGRPAQDGSGCHCRGVIADCTCSDFA